MIATTEQRAAAFIAVHRAVAHLIEKHGEQSAASSSVGDDAKLKALYDEADEVWAALRHLRAGAGVPGHTVDDELAQVAAVAIAWLASRQTTDATDG